MYRALSALIVLAGLAGTAAPPPFCLAGPSLDAPTSVKVHQLIRLTVIDPPAGAAVAWDYDDALVDAHIDGPRLTATAPPGRYRFSALVVSIADGKPVVAQLRAVVTVEGTTPPVVPTVPPTTPPAPKKGNARAALCRLLVGSSGTIIGPRRGDGRWDVLTAHHCCPAPGLRGQIVTSSGKKLGVKRVVADSNADLCWMVTDDSVDDLPFALLAATVPDVGVNVWHAGFGVDKPGNLETGKVVYKANRRGQLGMMLSVSHGDSGGGIFRADTDELVSAVCCTSSIDRKGVMSGGTSVDAIKLRPK